jgi:hypothetical protein
VQWKIESFHKILQSGCKAEDSKLRAAQRLANLSAVFCILGWRVFRMTMLKRAAPKAWSRLPLIPVALKFLDHLAKSGTEKSPTRNLSRYLTKIARLESLSYLNRTSDPHPGDVLMWRDLFRLTNMSWDTSPPLEMWLIESTLVLLHTVAP